MAAELENEISRDYKRAIIHDLAVAAPGDNEPYIYKTIEVTRENFDGICEHLRTNPARQEAATIILFLRFGLTGPEKSHLPQRTPWLCCPSDVEGPLAMLRMLLVDPIVARTWPCIDTMDYAAALGAGGELSILHVKSSDASAALLALENALEDKPPVRALCLQTRNPLPENPLSILDLTVDFLEKMHCPGEDALALLSTMPSKSQQYEIIAMMIR